MYNIVAIISLLVSCYFLLRILRPAGPMECILAFFCLSTAQIVIWGYVLSCMSRLHDVRYWSLLSLTTAFVNFLIVISKRDSKQFPALLKPGYLSYFSTYVKHWYTQEISHFEKLILTPLILTVVLLGVVNLAVIVFSAPNNWDSMSYHLARVAYYLQHSNINYFDANYWAQVIHPKISPVLLLFTYVVSGRSENATQLVQFISYWVAVCSVYAISSKAGDSTTQSIFAATAGALLTEWLMQATTTQNDMILTAYVGATVYFLFAFRETFKWRYLGLAALGIGLSLGTKASSFLPFLSVALVALYIFFQSKGNKANLQSRLRDIAVLAGCTLLTFCIFALPSGYIENYRNFGNPIGPDYIRTHHSFEGKPISYIAKNGTKNLIRYGFDFFSLDGIPPISPVRKVQALMRFFPEEIVRRLGVDLETSEATRVPFNLQKVPSSYEDGSYWGILGFGLVWVMVLLSLVGVIKSTDILVLSLATVLFLLAQAYSGPYDPWRGRYFAMCAVFALPAIGVALQAKNRFVRGCLLLIVWIGCLSAISAVVFKTNSNLISVGYQDKRLTSIFTMDRMEQLTRSRSMFCEPLKAFDRLVPSNATVAVFLPGDSFEYPLFGEHLTRTIIPINSFNKGLQPIPSSADYLLYMKNGFPCAAPHDVPLGADWYLRRLTDTNRRCP